MLVFTPSNGDLSYGTYFWGKKALWARIKVNILNRERKWPEVPLKARRSWKTIAFRDAIIAYHCLSRNPKFAMEKVN